MPELMDRQVASAVLQDQRAQDQARIFEGNTQKPFGIQKVVLDLTTAQLETQPFRVTFPFRSLYVQEATDGNVYVYFKPETDNSYQSPVKLFLKDVLKGNYPIAGGSFFWDAQSSKSITLLFFTELDFTSGSYVQTSSGGVTLSDGTGFTVAKNTLSAAIYIKGNK